MATLQPSGIFAPRVIEEIQAKAASGLYSMRGFGTLRERRWATFDDLTFLPCSLTRIPLEGYREKCSTKTVLGTRFAKKPIELDIPVMITGMSWGALSYNAKVALAQGAAAAGSSNTTGDGGRFSGERSRYEMLAKNGQRPEIFIVGCVDSRVSPEVIFNAAPGEIGYSTPNVFYHNLQVAFEIDEKTRFQVGVDNVFDRKAPYIQSFTDANTDTMTYDLLGRRFYVGFRTAF